MINDKDNECSGTLSDSVTRNSNHEKHPRHPRHPTHMRLYQPGFMHIYTGTTGTYVDNEWFESEQKKPILNVFTSKIISIATVVKSFIRRHQDP